MAVDSTLLMREVDNIVNQGQGLTHYKLTCRIQAGTVWLDPVRLTAFSLERDYENNSGDGVILDVLVGKGDYAYTIVPKRDALSIVITATPLYENSDAQRTDNPTRTRRYRALLIDKENPALTGREPHSSSAEDLNLAAPKAVQFQLMDEGFYQSRMISVGRLYRKETPAVALRALLTETTGLISGDNRQQIFGVDLAPGYNPTVRDHVIVPHGTPLLKVPRMMQDQEGGVYATGLGCYLQSGYWYMFPLFNLKRFETTPRVLTIINVPSNRYMGAERTYRKSRHQIVVVAAGGASNSDSGLTNQLNKGNALRFTDARQLLTWVDHGSNKAVSNRGRNLFELEGAALESGFSNARWTDERATSNPFKHYTSLAARRGQYVLVEWQYGDSELLYPGMPVKYMTNVNNKVTTLYGLLMGVHEHRAPQEAGVTHTRFPASLTLKLFIEREGV